MKKNNLDILDIAVILLIIFAIFTFCHERVYAAETDFLYQDDVYQMCEEIADGRIQPEFVQAVIEAESTYNALAVNGDCIGLMQINKKWHEDRMKRLQVTDLLDPYQNIEVGVDYLCELFDKFEDPYLVLMTYNMKQSTAQKNYNKMDYSQYAKDICKRASELEIEHGK